MNDLRVGDTVRLLSGRTWMTVEKIDGDHVTCVWLDGGKERRGTYSIAVLSFGWHAKG